MARKFFVFISILFVSACGSKPQQVQLYILDHQPSSSIDRSRDEKITLVELSIAEYLDQSGLVMLQNRNEINVANYHIWGESLRRAIPRALGVDLAQLCNCQFTDNSLAGGSENFAIEIGLSIEKFYVTDRGLAEFSGHYWVRAGEGTRQRHEFNFSTDLETDGYPHAVTKLRNLVSELASDINIVTSDLRR